NGSYDNGTPGNLADDVDDVLLEVGPLHIGGSAGFALTVSTVDADTDGNGSADLIGATLLGLALDVHNAVVVIDGVARLTVSGKLAIATLKPAVNLVTPDTRRSFALQL